MRDQTRRNAGYLVGLDILNSISERLCWSEEQFEAAHAELVRRFNPTLVET